MWIYCSTYPLTTEESPTCTLQVGLEGLVGKMLSKHIYLDHRFTYSNIMWLFWKTCALGFNLIRQLHIYATQQLVVVFGRESDSLRHSFSSHLFCQPLLYFLSFQTKVNIWAAKEVLAFLPRISWQLKCELWWVLFYQIERSELNRHRG